MARTRSVNHDHEALFAASVIAGQATLGAAGFRQRDVRFFLELFSNWLEATTNSSTLQVHNTQIQRTLEQHRAAGWTKRLRGAPPRYRVTPEGILSLLRRLVERTSLRRLDEFFLVFHILDAYGARIRALIAESGLLASHRLLVDFDELLDPRQLIARERALVGRELERLSVRMQESRAMHAMTRDLLAKGEPLAAVIAAVERRFPYELNSQKPLRELLSGFPAAWQRSEISVAAERRAAGLWHPTRELLAAYDRILRELALDVSWHP